MNETARKPRVAGFALFTLFLAAVLVALGVWQLQRRVAKHQLIAALTERLAAAPVALPPPSQWSTLTPERDEFRRVTFAATYESRLDAMVYSSGSAIRSDISGPGTWAFLPARLPGGDMVAVNAGFVPNTQQDRALQDRAVARLITNKPAMLTGYVRFPETASVLMPDAERDKRLWFTRDHLAMSRALGWGTVAPFYIDLERPVPENGIPRPGPLDVHLKDDHLQYAITWFALAGAVLIAFGVWARGRRHPT
ncbi:SURF1 family cytochrome oxidase biogenesis protein [Bradyrhizobium sp. LA6.12]|uniref:SURF1 family protein n=1 Tax=unclassified Bradyrhizobium TaxID=2631580 RepID=UPI0033986AFF